VVTAGGELFTGNTAFMTAGVIEGKATMGDLVKNWIVSYAGNFIGSVLLAYLVFASGVMAGPSVATVKAVAVAKTSIPFTQAVIRGVLCNWLVVMGIWQVSLESVLFSLECVLLLLECYLFSLECSDWYTRVYCRPLPPRKSSAGYSQSGCPSWHS
jgi:hypothetical protein